MWLFLLLSALLPAHAEDLYTTGAVTAFRWSGANETTFAAEAGEKVAVVLRDGAMVRVRHGGDFGWIPTSLLTTTAPEKPADSLSGNAALPDGATTLTLPGAPAPSP